MRLLFLLVLTLPLSTISTALYGKNKSSIPALHKIVVTGTVPGPDLWKVSNGENTLWVLGTLSPLPKKMDWNFKPIEQVIQTSQVLLLPPRFTVSLKELGFFKKLSLATSVFGIKKNPNKQKLIEVLPADLYARWVLLKKQYLGHNRSIEKSRPIFASYKLFNKALKKHGMSNDTGVTKKVRKAAKRSQLELLIPSIEINLEDPKAKLKKFKTTEINDLECFAKTMERIENDLDAMQKRAIAWSFGDIATIKALPYVDDGQACNAAWLNSELAEEVGITDVRLRLRTRWLDAAKSALANNTSTFALWPISQLLSDDSILNDFEAAGYTITAPKPFSDD